MTGTRPPLVTALGLVPVATPPADARAEKIAQQAEKVVDAKVELVGRAAPAVATASAVVKSAREDDKLQLTAAALKLSSETLAKKSPAASSLGAGGQLLHTIDKAREGDAFGAASAASAAAEQLSPALAKSGVGAIASAVVLGTGDDPLAAQAKALGESAGRVLAPSLSPVQRLKAAFDMTIALQGLAGLGRTLTLAAINVGRFGLRLMGRAPALKPAAAGVERAAGAVAASGVGRVLGFLNKWIPLLNVACVALAAKTAIDVFRGGRASTTSKALAVTSLGTAGAALWAGLKLGGPALLGVVALGIAGDLLLAAARKRDAATGDTDALAKRWLANPGEAGGVLLGQIRRAQTAISRRANALVARRVEPASAENGRPPVIRVTHPAN